MPVGRNVDNHLTRLAVQRGIKQTFAFPRCASVQFDTRDGVYTQYDAGTFVGENSAPNAAYGRRKIGGDYIGFDFGETKVELEMEEFYAYKEFDRGEIEKTGGQKLYEKAVPATHMRHNIARELGFHEAVFTTGNWTNSVIAAADRFNNAASNPPDVVRRQWETIAVSAAAGGGARKVMIIPPVAMNHLMAHPVYTKLDPQAEITGFATHETVAKSFGLKPDELWVPESTYNVQRLGETPSNERIFSEAYVWMGYMPANLTEEEQTALAYIYLNSVAPEVRRNEVDDGRQHYKWMREVSVGQYKPVDTAAALLLTSVYA